MKLTEFRGIGVEIAFLEGGVHFLKKDIVVLEEAVTECPAELVATPMSMASPVKRDEPLCTSAMLQMKFVIQLSWAWSMSDFLLGGQRQHVGAAVGCAGVSVVS